MTSKSHDTSGWFTQDSWYIWAAVHERINIAMFIYTGLPLDNTARDQLLTIC